MSEKISIIIPVYKVEDYLETCIDSILAQTYKNLEIILVDDGSPDSCGSICDRYARVDARIRVIHKENAGVARARNDGLDIATGDYISFIDSDDWIAPDTYECLYRELKKQGADCAVGGCVTVYDREGKLEYPDRIEEGEPECRKAEDVIRDLLLHASAVWNRLFKKEIFQEIRFPLDRVNDDEVVALHAYAECSKIVFLHHPTYYYRIRGNSITTSEFSLRNMDYYYNSQDNLSFIRIRMPQLIPCAEYKVYKSLLYCYVNLRKLEKTPQTEQLKKKLREDIRHHRKADLKNHYLDRKFKLLFFLIR